MILCPANGVDTFKKFNGNAGAFDASQVAVYRDNMQSLQHHRAGDRPHIDIVPHVVLEIGSAPQLLTQFKVFLISEDGTLAWERGSTPIFSFPEDTNSAEISACRKICQRLRVDHGQTGDNPT
jgi:hypothetical protein